MSVSEQKLFSIAKIIAKYDSIAEGWVYNKNHPYNWKRFLIEKKSTEKSRSIPVEKRIHYYQNYYNVSLEIYK
jgi:hypothetical protein